MGVALLLAVGVITVLWLVWIAPKLMTAFVEALEGDEDVPLKRSDLQRWTRDD